MEQRLYTCAYCGETKKYPQEFPIGYYGQCNVCYEKRHRPKHLLLLSFVVLAIGIAAFFFVLGKFNPLW